MNSNYWLWWVLLFGFLGSSFDMASASPSQEGGKNKRKPNIILILADDLGYGDLGCYGNPNVRTPNIDRLAKTGLRFTDFHANAPMCTPTRAALLTGRYTQRFGLQSLYGTKPGNPEPIGMPLEEETFAELLKKQGYVTALFGKWHLGYGTRFNPTRQGFDEFVGFLSGEVDYQSHVDRAGNPDWWKNTSLLQEQGYSTHLITEHSLRFIKQHEEEPFCLYIAHEAVHLPYQGPRDQADRTPGQSWDHLKAGSRKDRVDAHREMLESMDQGIGRVVETLQELGLEQDTLVFFCSDNGAADYGAGSNQPLRSTKGTLWEGGHRVPAVAYWPGRVKPGVVRQTVLTMDLLPTMAALAGVPLPEGRRIDGTNLLPLIVQGSPLPERTLFWRSRDWGRGKMKAARRGPWKLLVTKTDTHLFHLVQDLRETTDLKEVHPQLVTELSEALSQWEREVDTEYREQYR